ncbi:hypothetical protein [Pantoea sp. V106_11]|uniref:hypothetical protein n=1 Tax=Pantoea sp. V106_11 TaxID=3044234 RepID=UPI00249F23A7|nr:hypothetical protein [Pantoea sp. V106_11]MDI3415706.1 hypothetical protein [Pantoea sp. V106_11]
MKFLTTKFSFPIVLALLVAFTSTSLIMMNTGDYYRSVFPFIESIPNFSNNLPFSYPLKESFSPLDSYEYKSSYSLIIYAYASLVHIFSNTFSITLYSSILKFFYVIIASFLFLKIAEIEDKKLLFVSYLLCIAPLISSSNLAFFGSFYQEQVLLILLPLLLLSVNKRTTEAYLTTFLSVTIIACSKGQFFYFPAILFCYYLIYDRKGMLLKIPLVAISLALSFLCMMFTTSTVAYNKYHSVYFGVYEYERMNGIELPEGADKNCVGIDSWGNRFDLKSGVVSTSIGEECFNKHKDATFKETIDEILKHPSMLLKLPFDDGVKTQLTENYFHVYKAMPLIINNNGFYEKITNVKDALFKNIRFFLLVLALVFSLALRNAKISGLLFLCSSLGISQFYISFIGEGYRDMDKHLFGMNFSFDMAVFLVIASIFSLLKKNR